MRNNRLVILLVITACLAAVLLFPASLGGPVIIPTSAAAQAPQPIATSQATTTSRASLSEAALTAPPLSGRSAEARGLPAIGVGFVLAVLVCSLGGVVAVLSARRRRSLPEL